MTIGSSGRKMSIKFIIIYYKTGCCAVNVAAPCALAGQPTVTALVLANLSILSVHPWISDTIYEQSRKNVRTYVD